MNLGIKKSISLSLSVILSENHAAFRKSRDEIGDWIKEYFTLQWGKLQGSLD